MSSVKYLILGIIRRVFILEVADMSQGKGSDGDRKMLHRMHYASCLAFGAGGALLTLLIVGVAAPLFFDLRFLGSSNCALRGELALCMFSDQWNESDYLSLVTNFYNVIITLMIGFLGIVAAFAFYAIRSSSFQHAEEMMASEVQRYFATSAATTHLQSTLAPIVDGRLQDISSSVDEIRVALVEQDILPDTNLEVDGEEEAK